MRYFPVFLDTHTMRALIVGAGEVASRKLELLLKTHAQIDIVAPWVSDTVAKLASEHSDKIHLHKRVYQSQDLQDKQLVFVATDDNLVNQQIHQEAKAAGILVNVVDNTPLCEFITPSIIDRSPIVIAMSSGGVAPVLLRYLRQKLESWIPQHVARLGQFSEHFRDKVKAAFDNVNDRRNFWESVFDGQIAEEVIQGNDDTAGKLLLQKLEEREIEQGQVYLVGAGPGDADLLTFRALRLMQKADVVVYDRLVSADVLELVRRDAEKIYVGKAKSNHTLPQENINQLLVRLAKEGNRVVRLKGGDPFIFGRGGEEIETLLEHNIRFQVVPGITAASGAASYAGIPLTHRDHAQSVVFSTGHLRDNSIDLDWQALVQKDQTLVFYMGLTGLSIICEQLIRHGMPKETPIALVQSATRPEQKVLTATLQTIQAHPQLAEIKPPTLIIVGSVVSLHEQMQWFQADQR